MAQHHLAVTIGLGVDIIRTGRFRRLLLEKNGNFVNKLAQRVLHKDHEYPTFIQLHKTDINRCVNYISGSWAAKEALFKTLDLKDQTSFKFNQWYRHYDTNGKPHINHDSYHQNEKFLLSISHDDDILIANVLRQKYIEL